MRILVRESILSLKTAKQKVLYGLKRSDVIFPDTLNLVED